MGSGKELAFREAPMLPGTASAADALRLAESFQIEVEGFGKPALLDRLPTPDERRLLQARNADLRSQLRPANLAVADQERGRGALSLMFGGYPSMRGQTPREKNALIDTYWGHLQSLPAFAIIRACDDVIHNRVADLDPDWPPTTPRIVKQAQGYVAKAAAEQMRLEHILSAQKAMVPLMDQAARDRVAAGLNELAKAIDVGTEVMGAEDRAKRRSAGASFSEREILRQYRAAGIEPRYTGGGKLLVSPALAEYGKRELGRMAEHGQQRAVEAERDKREG
jgi:hypothetical protein